MFFLQVSSNYLNNQIFRMIELKNPFTIIQGPFVKEWIDEGGVVMVADIERPLCSSSNQHLFDIPHGSDDELIRWTSYPLPFEPPGDGVRPPYQMPQSPRDQPERKDGGKGVYHGGLHGCTPPRWSMVGCLSLGSWLII